MKTIKEAHQYNIINCIKVNTAITIKIFVDPNTKTVKCIPKRAFTSTREKM